MEIIKTEAFVLKKVDFGEADRLLHLFTKKMGKVTVSLKGIRKSQKRDRVSVDLISLSNFVIVDKNDRKSVSDMSITDPFMEFRKSLTKTSIAMYIIKILDYILTEEEKNIELFNITLKYFQVMKNYEIKDTILFLLYYIYRLIKNQGLEFEIEEKGVYFDFENGLIGRERGGLGENISEREKKIIYFLKIVDKKGINGLKLKEKECFELIELFEKYLKFHLNMKIKLKEFIIEEAL